MHKNKAVEGIKQEESAEIRQIASDYNEEVSRAIHQMHIRDNKSYNENRYKEQTKQIQQVTSNVLLSDTVAEQSKEQDLKPWPPKGKTMII